MVLRIKLIFLCVSYIVRLLLAIYLSIRFGPKATFLIPVFLSVCCGVVGRPINACNIPLTVAYPLRVAPAQF